MAHDWSRQQHAASPAFPSGYPNAFESNQPFLNGTHPFPLYQQHQQVYPGPPPSSLNSAWIAASSASLLPSAPTANYDIIASLNNGLNASNLNSFQQQQPQFGSFNGQQPLTWSTPAPLATTNRHHVPSPPPSADHIPFESLHHQEWVGLDFETQAAEPASALATSRPPASIPTSMGDTAHLGQLLRASISDELAFEALPPTDSDFSANVFPGRSSSRQSTDFFSERNIRPGSQLSGTGSGDSQQDSSIRQGQSVTDSGVSVQDGMSKQHSSRSTKRSQRLTAVTLESEERLRETEQGSDDDVDDSGSVQSSSSEEYIAPKRGNRRGQSQRAGKRSKGKGSVRGSGAKAAKRFLVGEDSSGSLPCNKRFPNKSTQVLKDWLFEHALEPYPNEEVKQELMLESGLSLAQLNNWFINARRRLLDTKTKAKKGRGIKTKQEEQAV